MEAMYMEGKGAKKKKRNIMNRIGKGIFVSLSNSSALPLIPNASAALYIFRPLGPYWLSDDQNLLHTIKLILVSNEERAKKSPSPRFANR